MCSLESKLLPTPHQVCIKSNLPPISLTNHLIFHIRYVSCVEYSACVFRRKNYWNWPKIHGEISFFCDATLCARTLLLPNA